RDLKRHKYPPVVAAMIQYSPRKHQDTYTENGLRYIRQKWGYWGPYADILEELAEILVERAMEEPLPPLSPPASLAKIRDAFAPPTPDHPHASAKVADMSSDSILIIYLSARDLPAPESRAGYYGSGHPSAWSPFKMDGAGGIGPF